MAHPLAVGVYEIMRAAVLAVLTGSENAKHMQIMSTSSRDLSTRWPPCSRAVRRFPLFYMRT